MGGDLLNWHRVLVEIGMELRRWMNLKYDAKREARKETFKPRAPRPKVNIVCLRLTTTPEINFLGAKVIGRQKDRLEYDFL